MTNTELSGVMAWIEVAIGKPICEGSREEKLARMVVYFEMLGDLPLSVLRAAAAQAVLEPTYGRFPEIALLRRLATSIKAGPALTFADAWPMALSASNRMNPVTNPVHKIFHAGKVMTPSAFNEQILERLPRTLAKAVRCFRPGNLIEDERCRAEFRRVYEEIIAKEKEERYLPPALAATIDAIGKEAKTKELPAPSIPSKANADVREIAGRIGLAG